MDQFYYNSLSNIRDASKVLYECDEDWLAVLGPILIRHNLHPYFGISLVHRHFSLEEGEQLIELRTSQGDDIISSVFKNGVPDSHVLNDYNLLVPQRATIVPSVFLVREGGVVPYEYSCIEKEQADKGYLNILGRIDKEFYSEWVMGLERLNLVDKFGLGFLDDTTDGRVEDTYKDKRVSVYRRYKVGEDTDQVVPTMWTADGREARSCRKC
jgi:hypothetical protein